MDLDKIGALLTKIGFPAGVAIWFMFKIQGFLDALQIQNATIIEILRQLVELHRK